MSRDMELAAVMKVRDEMSGPMAAAAQKGVAAVQQLADSDEKLAQSSAKVAQSTATRVSAARQAELAIKKEADADNYLEHQIASLNQEYVKLRAEAARQIQTTGKISEETLKAAAALKEKGEAATLLRGRLDGLTGGLTSMPPKIALISLVATAGAAALSVYGEMMGKVDTSLASLSNGVSKLEVNAIKYKAILEDLATSPVSALIPFQKQIASVASMWDRLTTSDKDLEIQRRSIEIQAEGLQIEKDKIDGFREEQDLKDWGASFDKQQNEEQRRVDAARLESAKKLAAEKDKADAAAKREAATLASIYKDMGELEAKGRENKKKSDADVENAESAHMLRRANAEKMLQDWLNKRDQDNAERKAHIENEILDREQQIAQGVGNAMGAAMEAIITGSESADKALGRMAIRIAQMLVQIQIAQAMAAGSIGGVFGGALGLGIIGGIGGLLFKAEGGWVEGGIPGRDSVKAMLMPGEYVASVKEQEEARRDPDAAVRLMNRIIDGQSGTGGGIRDRGVRHYADGGRIGVDTGAGYQTSSGRVVTSNENTPLPGITGWDGPIFAGSGGASVGSVSARQGPGGGVSVVINQSSLVPGTNEDLYRTARAILPFLRALDRNGFR